MNLRSIISSKSPVKSLNSASGTAGGKLVPSVEGGSSSSGAGVAAGDCVAAGGGASLPQAGPPNARSMMPTNWNADGLLFNMLHLSRQHHAGHAEEAQCGN